MSCARRCCLIGYSEILLEQVFGELNAKQAEYLESILASSRTSSP